eukprot:TRINITY_DN90676_c0_g1_i1.p1 TRINITY_DN90676_c0_g1~~TRINITY_DN90676_c0_g1_i1.p1  ORF type:complete len:232 (+),score=38.02 TRINITY_DN90676_c0_g1_i1:44-739(+)
MVTVLSKLLELDVRLTREAQSMALGWLEILVYPGSLAFSWEGVGFSLAAAALRYGFQPLRLILFALVYGQFANRILKMSFQRERPTPPDKVSRRFRTIIIQGGHADGSAFPSGDTMAGSATGAALALAGCGNAWWLLGVYVGYGRVYFLAHHILDVLAGYAEGCAVALLASKVIALHNDFEWKQLIGLLVAGVGFFLAMKVTKKINASGLKPTYLGLLGISILAMLTAPKL